MPSIDWVFLCDYAFVDASGKASIIGVFENIGVGALPATHSQMYIALGMKLAPGDNFSISAKITSPTGKEVQKVVPQQVNIAPNITNVQNAVINFGFYSTVFGETGEHHIEIFINNSSVHFIPINIQLVNSSK